MPQSQRNSRSATVLQLAALLAAAIISGGCAEAVAQRAASDRRIMPPQSLQCNRDQLTSYAGIVTDYRVDDDTVILTIATDWGSTETVEAPSIRTGLTLVNGRPLQPADVSLVEATPGKLHPHMRVIAWVCLDDAVPVVLDWRPPPQEQGR